MKNNVLNSHSRWQQRQTFIMLWLLMSLFILGAQQGKAQIISPAQDTIICQDIVALIADPAFGSGIWSVQSGEGSVDSPTAYETNVSVLLQTTNTIRWTIDSDNSFTEVLITNNEFVVEAGQNAEICSFDTLLNGIYFPQIGDATISWETTSGAEIGTNDELTTWVRNLDLGQNTFQLTVQQSGCSFSDNIIITNNLPPKPNAGADSTICGREVQLFADAPAPYTGEWTRSSGLGEIITPSAYNSEVINIVNTAPLTLIWSVDNDLCTHNDTIVILSSYIQVYAGGTKEVCDSNSTLGFSGASEIGIWYIIDNVESTILDSSVFNTPVYDLMLGENKFEWVVDKNGCLYRDTMIVVNDLPSTPFAGRDSIICGNEINLYANEITLGTAEWRTTFGGGQIVSPNDKNTLVTNLGIGANKFTWSISLGDCLLEDEVMIYNNLIQAFAGNDQTGSCALRFSLSAMNPIPGYGAWTLISGNADILSPDLYNSYVDVGDNNPAELEWETVVNGCTSSDNIILQSNYVIATAQADTIVCDDFLISAQEPTIGNGRWSPLTGTGNIANPTLSITTVSDVNFGTNRFLWTVTLENCTATDTVEVTYNKIKAQTGIGLFDCGVAQLAANLPYPGNGLWTCSNVAANIYTPESPNTDAMLGLGDNMFYWTITYGGCADTDSLFKVNDVFYVFAGNDSVVCASFAKLNASDVPANATGTWTLVSGGGEFVDLHSPNTLVENILSPPAQNVFQWKVSDGTCDVSDEIIMVNNYFTTHAGFDQSTCNQIDTIQGASPSPGYGQWSVINDGSAVVESESSFLTRVNNLDAGANYFRWFVTKNGCQNADTTIVTLQLPTLPYAGADQIVCEPSAELNANNSMQGSGNWNTLSGNAIFESPTNFQTTVSNLINGNNELTWSISYNNCTLVDTIIIANNQLFVTTAENDTTCENYSTLLGSNHLVTGLWTVVSGYGDILFPTYFQTQVIDVDMGTNIFQWHVNKNSCSDSAQMAVVSNRGTMATIGSNLTICGEAQTLQGNEPIVGNGVWTVETGGATFADETLFNTTVDSFDFGTNNFKWTISKGLCSTFAEMTVLNNQVIGNAGEDFTSCSSIAQLNAGSPIPGYGSWTVFQGGGVIPFSHMANATAQNLQHGTNILVWRVRHDICNHYDTLYIINDSVSPAIAGEMQELCHDGTTVSAIAPIFGTGTWTTNGIATFENENNATTQVTNLAHGDNTLTWTVAADYCTESNDLIIHLTDCAWAGDTDYDGEVTIYDLLPIGIYYNELGLPRNNSSILWEEQFSVDWGNSLPSVGDAKHSDCNGDGIVNSNDITAIENNFSETHSKSELSNSKADIEMLTEIVYIGNNQYATIIEAEDNLLPLYGFGMEFQITGDVNSLINESITVDLENSDLGGIGTDLIKFTKLDAINAKLHIGVTRDNTQDVVLQGEALRIIFELEDNTDTTGMVFNFTSRGGINSSGERMTIDFYQHGTSSIEMPNTSNIAIYPNPANTFANIETKFSEPYTVRLIDVFGKLCFEKSSTDKHYILNTESLKSGVYFIQIHTKNEVINRKIEIIH